MVFATSAMLCWGQKSTKIDPTSFQKQLSNPCSNLDRFWSQLGSILEGFWGQGEPQLAPNRSKNRSQKRYKKRSHFRSPQDRFLIDFGLQLGGSRGVRWGSVGPLFGLLKPSWSQDDPKSPQDPSKRPLGTDFRGFWAPTW